MLIVSDTSPITNLLSIGKLDLLHVLFTEVVIPEKVYHELTIYENQKEEIDQRNWLTLKKVSNLQKVRELENLLDTGEAEAIVLAQEINADFLIVDERKGRKIAANSGLKITGLLGVLVAAKNRGYLPKLKPVLDELVNEIGFHVNPELYQRVLNEVKE